MEKISFEFRRLIPRQEQSRQARISEEIDKRSYQLTEVTSFKGGQRIRRLSQIYTYDEVIVVAREMRWLQKNGYKDLKLSPEIVESILNVQENRQNLAKSRMVIISSLEREPERV